MARKTMKPKIIIVTGYSGSGKTVVRRALEDIGYQAIENIPNFFLRALRKSISNSANLDKVALILSVDINNPEESFIAIEKLKNDKNLAVELVFLECDSEELLRRYQEQRRPHPAGNDRTISEAVDLEKQTFSVIKDLADTIIDTTKLSVKQVTTFFQEKYTDMSEGKLSINFISFGFKHGTPRDADMLFDARFLPNPFYHENLRYQTGLDEEVYEYVTKDPDAIAYMDKIQDLVEFSITHYEKIGKNNLSVAIACTGGQHRSVSIVEYLAKEFSDKYSVYVWHRDIEKRHRK